MNETRSIRRLRAKVAALNSNAELLITYPGQKQLTSSLAFVGLSAGHNLT